MHQQILNIIIIYIIYRVEFEGTVESDMKRQQCKSLGSANYNPISLPTLDT